MLLAQAQTMDAIPDSFWKYFCMSLLVLMGAAGAVIWITQHLRTPEPTRLNDNPPIEVRKAPRVYNHEATEARLAELERRLEAHDVELRSIQEDRARTLRHINARFERVLVGIASIAGQVGATLPAADDYVDKF